MTELLFTGEQLGRLALQFLLAGAGTLSFAILFACPKRTLPYCGLVGAVGCHPADAAGPHPCDNPQDTGNGIPAHRHLSAGARCGHLLQRLLLHSGQQRSGAGKRHLYLQDRRGAGRGHCACAGHPPAAETPIKQKRDRPPGGLVGYAGAFNGRMQRRGKNTGVKCIYTQRMWCCMYKCFQKGFICSDFLHNT